MVEIEAPPLQGLQPPKDSYRREKVWKWLSSGTVNLKNHAHYRIDGALGENVKVTALS